jgi:hypothetical protein
MNWFEIIALSALFGLTNWFNNKNFTLALKEFLIAFLFIAFLKVIFSFIKMPDLPESITAYVFAGPILLVTIILLFRAYKKNKK